MSRLVGWAYNALGVRNMALRIYRVEDENSVTLVKSNSAAKALQYVAKCQYTVRIASGIDVADYMAAGGEIEDSSKEQESEAAEVEAPETDDE